MGSLNKYFKLLISLGFSILVSIAYKYITFICHRFRIHKPDFDGRGELWMQNHLQTPSSEIMIGFQLFQSGGSTLLSDSLLAG